MRAIMELFPIITETHISNGISDCTLPYFFGFLYMNPNILCNYNYIYYNYTLHNILHTFFIIVCVMLTIFIASFQLH